MVRPRSYHLHPIYRKLSTLQSGLAMANDLQEIGDKVIAQIEKDLKEAHDLTLERLHNVTGTWDIVQAQRILAELERQQQQWNIEWVDLVQDAIKDALGVGEDAAMDAAKTAGIEVSAQPFISTSFLEVTLRTLPDQISSLNRKFIDDVGRVLRLSVLAQKTPLDVIHELGDFAHMGKEVRRAGPFSKAFADAERITRTELGRISQTANYLTLLELQRHDPRWMKVWRAVHDGRTRPAHAQADGQKVKPDEPFTVGGEKLQFPGDPRGSAAEVINCRCVSVPWHPAFENPEEAALPSQSTYPLAASASKPLPELQESR